LVAGACSNHHPHTDAGADCADGAHELSPERDTRPVATASRADTAHGHGHLWSTAAGSIGHTHITRTGCKLHSLCYNTVNIYTTKEYTDMFNKKNILIAALVAVVIAVIAYNFVGKKAAVTAPAKPAVSAPAKK